MIRQRVRAWWQSRLKPVDSWTLHQRNVYIVPTAAGFFFGFTLLVLLLASINYQLNLGYALTFLLAGSAAASMHITHGTLRGLTFHVRQVSAVHAGQAAEVVVVITNPGRLRYGIGFRLEQAEDEDAMAWVDPMAQAQTSVAIRQVCRQRGRHVLPLLRAETRFPFGLFRAWTVWRPAGEYWVWPAIENPVPALPPPAGEAGQGQFARPTPTGEFDGVRPWRRGDSSRQVAWKKVARSGELISRDAQESSRLRLWLEWQSTGMSETEARLSRLATWALSAHQQNLPFGLRLPRQELPLDQGNAHFQMALEALALYPGAGTLASTGEAPAQTKNKARPVSGGGTGAAPDVGARS